MTFILGLVEIPQVWRQQLDMTRMLLTGILNYPSQSKVEKRLLYISVLLSGKTVVYGSSLDAYCCVQTLLSMGLPGDKVLMIQPPSSYEVI